MRMRTFQSRGAPGNALATSIPSPAFVGRAAATAGIALCLSHASALFASEDSARLAGLLADTSAYRADFEQVVMNRFGETLQTSTGRMHLQRPGRLRWEVNDPYPQLVLADGNSLWVYDPDLEQASVRPLAAAIEGSPAVFLTGMTDDVASHFEVRRAEPAVPGGLCFVLAPKDQTSVLQDATLTFSAEGVLVGLDIVDHLGQTTRIGFKAAELNPVLESTLFEFEVPQGIDIIGDVPATAPREPVSD